MKVNVQEEEEQENELMIMDQKRNEEEIWKIWQQLNLTSALKQTPQLCHVAIANSCHSKNPSMKLTSHVISLFQQHSSNSTYQIITLDLMKNSPTIHQGLLTRLLQHDIKMRLFSVSEENALTFLRFMPSLVLKHAIGIPQVWKLLYLRILQRGNFSH